MNSEWYKIKKTNSSVEVVVSLPLFDRFENNKLKITTKQVKDLLEEKGHKISSCELDAVSVRNTRKGENEKTWKFSLESPPKKQRTRRKKSKKLQNSLDKSDNHVIKEVEEKETSTNLNTDSSLSREE